METKKQNIIAIPKFKSAEEAKKFYLDLKAKIQNEKDKIQKAHLNVAAAKVYANLLDLQLKEKHAKLLKRENLKIAKSKVAMRKSVTQAKIIAGAEFYKIFNLDKKLNAVTSSAELQNVINEFNQLSRAKFPMLNPLKENK